MCVNTAHRLMLGRVTGVVTGVSVEAHGVRRNEFVCQCVYLCLCKHVSED